MLVESRKMQKKETDLKILLVIFMFFNVFSH